MRTLVPGILLAATFVATGFVSVVSGNSLPCTTPTAAERTIMVAADGSGQFRTVQAAIDSLPESSAESVVLRIRPGVYKERIVVGPKHPHLTFKGDGRNAAETTVLTFDLSARSLGPDGKPVGTSGSASVILEGDDFTAEDLTFENSAGPGSKVGQAVAVKVMADRCRFLHCRFLGWQDTLYASTPNSLPSLPPGNPPGAPQRETAPKPNSSAMPGAARLCRQYYRDCYIAGSVDFIFGSARAYFEKCELHSRDHGAVTAHARTEPDQPGAYVFHDCALTADPDVPAGSVILGRPWRPYAKVVYLNCRMGPHIAPRGWDNWNDPAREKTAFYAEADCTGPGADRASRVPWERTLTKEEAADLEPRRFLARPDGWKVE